MKAAKSSIPIAFDPSRIRSMKEDAKRHWANRIWAVDGIVCVRTVDVINICSQAQETAAAFSNNVT